MKKGIKIFMYGILILIFILLSMYFIIDFLYPIKYQDLIIEYSNKYQLNTSLVASIINVESGYNKDTVSSAGAIGLMQLMPDTAVEIASKLEFDNFKISDLKTPKINIEFGCYYLKYLLINFDNDLNTALAGYNAGLGNVEMWLQNNEYSFNNKIVKTPFKETNNFIKRVNRGISIYKYKI